MSASTQGAVPYYFVPAESRHPIMAAAGLFFVILGGPTEWKLPVALAVTVLISSYVIHIPTMWRQAPITAAIVIAASLTAHSEMSAVEHGLHKVAEVLFGCLVGVLVSWSMAKVWPLAKRTEAGP